MRISIDDCVDFVGSFQVEQRGYGYYCTFSGEFMRRGWKLLPFFPVYQSFDPPLAYSMSNVQVMSDQPESILHPIYLSLREERIAGRR